jgi:DinB superfamily
MHPRLSELLAHAEGVRAELLSVIDGASDDRWSAPGPEGGWSASQHVEHLYLVERSSLRALFRAFRDARAAGLALETETSSLLGALDHTGLAEGRTKVMAPEFVVPVEAPDRATARLRLAESRAGLQTWAQEVDGYALGAVTFPHPRLGTLSLYEWVLMIADHERRHLRRVRALVGSA